MEAKNQSKHLSDEDLVKEIVKSNDTLLFEVLYDRFAFVVYNKCLGFSKDEDEAKDLAQDVFLKLFIKLSSFKGKSKFSTWLYAFTYNHCVNYVNRNVDRKMKKQSVEVEVVEDVVDLDSEGEEFIEMRVEKLKEALDLILPDEKMLLLMKYQDFMSIKEIGVLLDLGESAVKMRLKRAKDKLVEVYTEIS